MISLEKIKICVVGLGYVGLPLAAEFGKKYSTTGFDLNSGRIQELREGKDSTLEVESEELLEAHSLHYTSDAAEIQDCNVYIVAVPTPIDASKRPDLTPLEKASETVGKVLSKGDIVVYESTVYPGATEEVCVPLLEKYSGLRFNEDFFCGYSPERINPGDKGHRLPTIVKVTSGSTPEVAQFVNALYASIITAGTFLASSIKVAEAAKVIENTQRDVNIALINELALIFEKLNINTKEVLAAAGTKWNFLPFQPGLVGGHCIGVDPYYLTHKAQEVGYQPDMILAGRRLNDHMGAYVANTVIKKMVKKKIDTSRSNVLVMGLSFKENCPDLRNTKVVDIIGEFKEYGIEVDVLDPWVNPAEAVREYGVSLITHPKEAFYDAIIMAVSHHQFVELPFDHIRRYGKENVVIYDVKGILPRDLIDGCL
ncbi:Vi polysaccharide biosynthesis UDP-N-acetylglucosamine C-6 dehydrogenase TviB [Desulforhopalus sp. IMCC35007]|uniref:Vi polysaccharide biosynthesis UDP-N-acetylglucosamine C-6 dehydrogenase TviB n=1 Tax=Desulforhopalus sp. IMCC35007 TaxID=2569543 RepID=UPI0010AE98BF|nr:Vi polysaccharide biosynthesis UDP-N-acetylglucosamine C-6 dehydrogenase TviB [Desulforhopalus sp. IMCC35007]TKB11112.1 Vi polysaccharide biosynthesis UDP-N-acetylglucosamine C-6 dehydrogenase TviB [Desulforhopalus sp. IMCC35007]